MEEKYREFCPKNLTCIEKCDICILANEKVRDGGDYDLQHEINKNYLKSIGKICLCCDCADI